MRLQRGEATAGVADGGIYSRPLKRRAASVEFRPVAGLPDNRRRWRRRLAWLGLACALAMILASAASYQTALVYLGQSYHVLVIGGGLLIQPSPAPVSGGLQWADATIPPQPFLDRLRDWFQLPSGMGSGSWFAPFGPPAATLAALSLFALWRRRRPEGHVGNVEAA